MAKFKVFSALQYAGILLTALLLLNYYKSLKLTLKNNQEIENLIASPAVKNPIASQYSVFGQSEFDPDGEFFNKKAMVIAALTVFALFPLYIAVK